MDSNVTKEQDSSEQPVVAEDEEQKKEDDGNPLTNKKDSEDDKAKEEDVIPPITGEDSKNEDEEAKSFKVDDADEIKTKEVEVDVEKDSDKEDEEAKSFKVDDADEIKTEEVEVDVEKDSKKEDEEAKSFKVDDADEIKTEEVEVDVEKDSKKEDEEAKSFKVDDADEIKTEEVEVDVEKDSKKEDEEAKSFKVDDDGIKTEEVEVDAEKIKPEEDQSAEAAKTDEGGESEETKNGDEAKREDVNLEAEVEHTVGEQDIEAVIQEKEGEDVTKKELDEENLDLEKASTNKDGEMTGTADSSKTTEEIQPEGEGDSATKIADEAKPEEEPEIAIAEETAAEQNLDTVDDASKKRDEEDKPDAGNVNQDILGTAGEDLEEADQVSTSKPEDADAEKADQTVEETESEANALSLEEGQAQEKGGLPKDFFYNSEDYISGCYVTKESGLPTNVLTLLNSFGYDCRKRSNLSLLPGPTALFAAGNLVNLLDLNNGHSTLLRSCGGGGIGAVTVHPGLKYFVVAEKGIKPYLVIYEFPSLKMYRILTEGTERAYSFADFNPEGNLLATVGCAPDYMLTVWDWGNEKIMLRTKAFSQEIFRVKFSPEQEGQLTSSGTGHIRFWKMANTFTGLKLKGELGRFGKTALTDIDGYVQLPDGKVLSGSESGNMLLWDGGLIKVEICRKNRKPCHIGSIQQLVIDEGELITIGLDGYVRVWEMESIDTADTTDESDVFEVEPMNELRVGQDVQLTNMVKLREPDSEEGADDASTSIWFAQDGNGGIWKLDLSFSHTTKPPEKLFSYTAGPVTGIAASHVSNMFAVTGDSYVRLYDYTTKEVLCEYKCPLHSRGTSILWPDKSVDPKGTTIMAGFSNGSFRIFDLKLSENGVFTLFLKQALKPHTSDVTSIAIDSTKEILATASLDKTVFLFNLRENIIPIGFVDVVGQVSRIIWSPPGYSKSTLLISCTNGKLAEIESPSGNPIDSAHSYKISNLPIRYFSFQSVKSQLRRDEARERKKIEKEEKRKEKEKELKRRKARGDEFTEEEEKAFFDELEEEEFEEEPLFFPPTPNPILFAFYTEENKFVISVGGYDAGYLYECTFSDENTISGDPDLSPTEPVRSIAVQESNDVPATSIFFSKDQHSMLMGFENGSVRVYPMKEKIEIFDLELLSSPYWQLNMHDNDTGYLSCISESYDGKFIFSGGGDGNIFAYKFLPRDEIQEAVKENAAVPLSPKAIEEARADDIDDPQAYSIEDAKLKAEHDRLMKEAELKKMDERRKIHKLRRTFKELLNENDQLPNNVRLEREEFELDPSIRLNTQKATERRVDQVKLEMQWNKAKLALATKKLKDRFRGMLDCDRICVFTFKSKHMVSSYRKTCLSEEYHELQESMQAKLQADTFSSEDTTSNVMQDGRKISQQDSGEDDTQAEQQQFFRGAKQKQSILHGRQAEKVANALKKAEKAKQEREKRSREWDGLYKNKPDENYEDPEDVAAIDQAKTNMGDFKLKTAANYVVPEHLRMDTERKRKQILSLQGLIDQVKNEFNGKLIALCKDKQTKINRIREYVTELKKVQKQLKTENCKPVPKVPKMRLEEMPEKKYEYTRETLIHFQDSEKARVLADDKKKRAGGEEMFGGFGGQGDDEADKLDDDKMDTRSSTTASTLGARSIHESASKTEISKLEEQLTIINQTKCIYEQDRLLKIIKDTISAFDAELLLLRHEKSVNDIDLKMADLRQITLLEELLLLKEYEKREKTLSGRVSGKKMELMEVNNKASEIRLKHDNKRRDIDKLTDKEKVLNSSFIASLGENNKFADFLTKIFKKKIKRAKKKIKEEDGEEEESDEESEDESDWSSEEDDEDSMEGGFDDSVCPPGCDQQLFDDAIALREKRLDLEEAIVEEKKIAEQYKKDVDALIKKAKVLESQLKTALADLEAFQVEKQGKLNELDVVVPLYLHQVEHVANAAIPTDLTPCLVFTNLSLVALQRRIKELQYEKAEQRSLYKDARLQHVHLIKDRKVMEVKIERLEEKCEQMMMLKFGRIVDMEKLETVTVNRNVEEIKEKLSQQEIRNSTQLARYDQHIQDLKHDIVSLTRENTDHLKKFNTFMTDKANLEIGLNQRQKDMQLNQHTEKKSDIRERQRLVQLVQLQAQEIQALKEEIGLLSRKGGHILPPTQPPLEQDDDV